MRIALNKTEYRALNRLRGLPPDAHLLVMCCHTTPTGGTLDGSENAFEELVEFLIAEVDEGLAPATDHPALLSIAGKINPESLDWLGF